MAGRPRLKVSDDKIAIIEELAYKQCRDTTIAEAVGIAVVSFKRRFDKKCRQLRAKGKTELYKTQWQMAQNNPTMAQWLGKQYLDQSDKQDIKQHITKAPELKDSERKALHETATDFKIRLVKGA